MLFHILLINSVFADAVEKHDNSLLGMLKHDFKSFCLTP
jgi:hypothetical protein